MELLPDATLHRSPYRFVMSAHALGDEAAQAVARLFDEDVPWARHDASFYACFLAVVTDRIDPALLAGLPGRIGALLGVPLTDRVHVTVQRMEPGDHALVHTDRPLVGYEAARVVVQFNHGWRDEDGGLLEVHADADGGAVVASLLPTFDAAFAFAQTPSSHHAVTPAKRQRRSAVFNFWHVGNTEALAEHVRATFEGLRFDMLPGALDDVMLDAEATLPEDVTHRAGLIALVLTRWGYDPATVTRAYVRALDRTEAAGWPLVEGAADEEDAALALASWMTELHLDHFDLERWELVSGLLTAARASSWTRLSPTLALTFPPTRG